jgi:hypothetical protein
MMVPTAMLIHNTIITMLITGSHVPPARLHTIKSALHPDYAERLLCQDKDCLLKQSGCMGNRFVVVQSQVAEDGVSGIAGEVVRYIAPHHKNDRRGSNLVISYDLPPGPLTQLFLIHIREGHGVLSRFHRHAQPHLFMSSSGLAFTDTLFAVWWATFYSSHKGPEPYFPPSKGRTLFVEHFIASTGHQPQESWEGAAMAMGNSVKQWREFYAPRMKHRLAQEAVHKHREWREGMMAGPSAHAAAQPSFAYSSSLATDSVPCCASAQPTPPPPPTHDAEPPQQVKREPGVGVKVEPTMHAGLPSDKKRVKVEPHESAEHAPPVVAPSSPISMSGLPLNKVEPAAASADAHHPPPKKVKVESQAALELGLSSSAMHVAPQHQLEALHEGEHECGTTTTTTNSSSGWDLGEEPLGGVQEQEQVEEEEGWDLEQQLQEQHPAADDGAACMPHFEADCETSSCMDEDDDDVVITHCVQPRCRNACDAIDLTMSSSDGDDEF